MRSRFISFEKFSKILARSEKEICSRPEVAALIDELGLVRGEFIILPSGCPESFSLSELKASNKLAEFYQSFPHEPFVSRFSKYNKKYPCRVYSSHTNYKDLSLWED